MIKFQSPFVWVQKTTPETGPSTKAESDPYGGIYYGGFYVPNLILDSRSVTNQPYLNSAFFSCVSWLSSAFGQGIPCLCRTREDGTFEYKYKHPVLDLLRRPNKYTSRKVFGFASVLSRYANGNTYAEIRRNENNEPIELWWWPWHRVRPDGSQSRVIDKYLVWDGREHRPVRPENMFHWKLGIHPENTAIGISPVAAMGYNLTGDQESGAAAETLVKNLGWEVPVIWPEGEEATIEDADRKQIEQTYVDKTTGKNRGRPVVFSEKMGVQMVGAKIKDLDISTTRRAFNTHICTCFNLDPLVVGLEGEQSTYINKKEAREAAVESVVEPLHESFGEELGWMLLPEFGVDPNEWMLGFDPRRVRVLQGDQDKLGQRISLLFTSGIIDRYRALSEMGYVAQESDRDVYYEKPGSLNAKTDPNNPNNGGRTGEQVPKGGRKDV